MAKLGNAEYPDIGLLECLHTARTIQLDFGGEIKRGGLAHVLGMAGSGGAFAARLGSMRMWGIIEGRSNLRLTDAANRAVGSGNAGIEAAATSALARNVPLFNDLHARLQPGAADKAVLAATVQELTDAPMPDVANKLPQIERLFNEIRRYMELPDADRAQSDQNANAASVGPIENQTAGERKSMREAEPVASMTLSFDGGEMVMDETPDNIDLFITALETRKRNLVQQGAYDEPDSDAR